MINTVHVDFSFFFFFLPMQNYELYAALSNKTDRVETRKPVNAKVAGGLCRHL